MRRKRRRTHVILEEVDALDGALGIGGKEDLPGSTRKAGSDLQENE